MNTTILAGLPREFDALAVQAALEEDVDARLEALVQQTREAAGTNEGRVRAMEKVRGKLQVQKMALDTPGPALPNKPAHPHNQRQRAFYADAIARLTTVIEAG